MAVTSDFTRYLKEKEVSRFPCKLKINGKLFMMYKIFLVILCWIIVIFTIGCNGKSDNNTKNTDASINVGQNKKTENIEIKTLENNNINNRGNSLGNIANYGFVAKQGDWIYFSSSDAGKLYKMKTDGTNSIKLSDDAVWELNVTGEWIYYSIPEFPEPGPLYKIKIDGTGKTKLTDDYVHLVNILDGRIYYYNTDDLKIYKINTDGKEKVIIADEASDGYSIEGGWIYFRDLNSNIFKMKIDGTEKSKIINDQVEKFIIYKDWIYYTNILDNRRIYKINIDGTGRGKVNDDVTYDLNVAEGWIFYSNYSDTAKGELYKIKLDGTEKLKLSTQEVSSINIIDKWVYYLADQQLYRIKMDGTDRQLVK